jgi:SAM-dependent methyltransferase
MNNNAVYWDEISGVYQSVTRISTNDFHFGPLLPGERIMKIIPIDIQGKKCLELGCGGAQNSIYLSRQGGICTALDISGNQIEYAAELSARENQEVKLICTSMENPAGLKGKFDFIHSVYALPFSDNPEAFFRTASKYLKKSGYFLFSTQHPLMQTETIELDGEFGIFMPDYFNPPTDIRFDDENREIVRSTAYNFHTLSNWIYESGMVIYRIFEPFTDSDLIGESPYVSEQWLEYLRKFRRVPSTVIMICVKK